MVATIAFRFQTAVSRSTRDFGSFNVGKGSRTTGEIARHIYELLKASGDLVETGEFTYTHSDELILSQEIERINAELIRFDGLLAEKNLDENISKRLLQGPLADILTHIGQIAMMSRLNGHPITGVSYSTAPVSAGKLKYF